MTWKKFLVVGVSFLFLLTVMSTSTALAKRVVINIPDKPGTTSVAITLSPTGVVTFEDLQEHVVGSDPTKPPTDPDNPNPNPSKVLKKISELTKSAVLDGGTLKTAKVMQVLVKTVADQLAAGDIDEDKSAKLLTLGIPLTLSLPQIEDSAKWKDWGVGTVQLLKDQQSKNEYSLQTLRDIEAGIEAGAVAAQVQASDGRVSAAIGRGIFKDINILELIKLIMSILATLKGFGL